MQAEYHRGYWRGEPSFEVSPLQRGEIGGSLPIWLAGSGIDRPNFGFTVAARAGMIGAKFVWSLRRGYAVLAAMGGLPRRRFRGSKQVVDRRQVAGVVQW
jgi:hypothetical protein